MINFELTAKENFAEYYNTRSEKYLLNILARHFFMKMCTRFKYDLEFNEDNFNRILKIYKKGAIEYIRIEDDHTIFYCMDVVSNKKILDEILTYPWEDWKGHTVLEVGSGFGVFTYLFNLIKEYFDIDVEIVSIDFSESKINSLNSFVSRAMIFSIKLAFVPLQGIPSFLHIAKICGRLSFDRSAALYDILF